MPFLIVQNDITRMSIDACCAKSYVCNEKGLADNADYLDDAIRVLRRNSTN